jgi:hypothetical protein
MGIRPRLAAPLAAALLASVACGTSRLEVLDPGLGGGEGGVVPASDGGAPPPGTQDGGETAAGYCSGAGSPLLVAEREGGVTATCVGGLAQSAFRYALCTCAGLVASAQITTDSFDSDAGPYDPARARAGGGLGTNGTLSVNAPLNVGGSLWASDATGMTISTASAAGALHVGGPVSSGPSLTVGGDAFVLGKITAQGDLSVAGTLYQPSGVTPSVGGTSKIGATASASFTVPPACDCDPALLVDIAGYVEAYRANNDDAAVGVSPTALENVQTDLTLNVPCGRVFFTRVGGTAAIHLVLAPGRTAIFIGGDLSSNGPFTIDVSPSSELDLFVEGNVVAGAAFTLGSAATPSKARLWVGGTGTINLPSTVTLAGNLYGPLAQLVLGASPITIYGSVFVRRVSSQGALTIHYDEEVLAQGGSCPAPVTCSSCHDCGNQACVAGACGACTNSSECCSPLVCQSGRCVPSIIP